eukprot:COSAG02_NODE_3598_length_6507_cov_15.869538_8_plen_94_part_00
MYYYRTSLRTAHTKHLGLDRNRSICIPPKRRVLSGLVEGADGGRELASVGPLEAIGKTKTRTRARGEAKGEEILTRVAVAAIMTTSFNGKRSR